MCACAVLALEQSSGGRVIDTVKYSSKLTPFTGKVTGRDQTVSGRENAVIVVQVSLQPNGKKFEVRRDICMNACQGPPPTHKTHAECERSCDRPCGIKHSFEVSELTDVQSEGGRTDFDNLIESGVTVLAKRGFDLGSRTNVIGRSLTEALSDFLANGMNNLMKVNVEHAVINPYAPCAGVERVYRSTGYNVVVSVDLHRYVYPDGETNAIDIPLGDPKSATIASLYRYEGDVTVHNFVQCMCEEKPKKTVGLVPTVGTRVTPFEAIPASYAHLQEQYGTGGFELTGIDLNHIAVATWGMESLYFPPGTRFVPDDDEYQEMTSFEAFSLGDYTEMSLGGGAPMQIQVFCTEQGKHQPDGKVKYLPAAPKDLTVSTLMHRVSLERHRGPWDQVRLWIYTDKIPYDQAKTRLVPSVDAGQYLTLLHDVVRIGRQDGANAATYEKLVEPGSVLHPDAEEDAREWGMYVLMKNDNNLDALLDKKAINLYTERAPQATAVGFATMMRSAILSSSKSRGKWIQKVSAAIPDSLRAQFESSGGDQYCSLLALSPRPEDQEAALALAKAHTGGLPAICEMLRDIGVNEKIRKAAADALKPN